MAETPSPELTPEQIAALQRLLKAGFEFVQLEHVVRYLPVEKNGFVALLDPSGARLGIFGQIGYRIGEGVGMLIESQDGKAFVWKNQSVEATPALLETYARFRGELEELLQGRVQ
jgi:hypothetical protein